MLVALLIGLVVVVGVAVYFLKRKKVEDVYVDSSTLTYDDIYPIGALAPEEPAPVEPPPVVEPVVKAAPKKKAIAKKKVPKKRGRPAKKTKK